MDKFVVELELRTPALITQPPMLDSILAWCAVQEAGGEWSAQEKLPLEERELHGEKYWAASRFFFKFKPSSPQLLIKRSNLARIIEYTDVKIRISGGSGPHKNFCDNLVPQWIDKAVAFGVGDIDEVDYLLSKHLTHFGRNVRNGSGKVRSMVVRKIEGDYTENIEGLRVRPLPASPDDYDVIAGIRPPYWQKAGFIPVKIQDEALPILVKNDFLQS